jgi:hypothetical protein
MLGQDDDNDWGKDGVHLMADLPPINLGVGRKAASVCCGFEHTCAILDNNKVKCWGRGSSGQLGYDNQKHVGIAQLHDSVLMADLDYVFLGIDRTAVSLTCGAQFTCVVMDDGNVKCWGNNAGGALGQDNTYTYGKFAGDMEKLIPVDLGEDRTAVGINAGSSHVCAILDNGDLKCWGQGNHGQLGSDQPNYVGKTAGSMAALQPVFLGEGRTALAVRGGYWHTCVLLDNLDLKCFGYHGGPKKADNTLGYGSTNSPDSMDGDWGAGVEGFGMHQLQAVPLEYAAKIPAFPECS